MRNPTISIRSSIFDYDKVSGSAFVPKPKHSDNMLALERASYSRGKSGQSGSSKTVRDGKVASSPRRKLRILPIVFQPFETSGLFIKPAFMALVIFSLAACQREEMSYYEIPKEESRAQLEEVEGSQLPPGHPEVPTALRTAVRNAENPTWLPPSHWLPGTPSQLQRASFTANGNAGERADISITTFPGKVGGALANINRWRRQIGLGPITEEQINEVMTELEINRHHYQLVELSNDVQTGATGWPQSSVIATRTHQGNSWFFKLSGDQPLVSQEREAFLRFLGSVEFEER